jgi:F0F1-type ATP synthase assembly protein I
MPDGLPDSRETGRLFAFAQVGMEMVAPIVIGIIVDAHLDSAPWGVAIGAVVGLAAGLWHLTVLAKRFDESEPPRHKGAPP